MAKEYVEGGIPFLRSQNVLPFRLDLSDVKFIDADFHARLKKSALRPGDVVIVRTGKPGTAAVVPADLLVANCSDLVIVRPGARLDSRFLAYYVNGIAHHHVNAHLVGAVQQHFNVGSARTMPLFLPPLPEQRRIAEILGALDDKIELNRKMNQTLEEMAQAIFKSWFIDFDGHTEFVDSELGRIPKGWRVLPLPEVMTFREGPGIMAKDFHETGVPLLRLAGLKGGISLLAGCNYLDPVKVAEKWEHFRLLRGDVLLSTSASLGRVAEVDDEAVGAVPYTGIIAFRPVGAVTQKDFIRHYLASPAFQREIEAIGVGSVLRHFGPTHLKRLQVPAPPIGVQDQFGSLVSPMTDAIRRRVHESVTLTQLRDTLLPKLISGELRVPEAEKCVEFVA